MVDENSNPQVRIPSFQSFDEGSYTPSRKAAVAARRVSRSNLSKIRPSYGRVRRAIQVIETGNVSSIQKTVTDTAPIGVVEKAKSSLLQGKPLMKSLPPSEIKDGIVDTTKGELLETAGKSVKAIKNVQDSPSFKAILDKKNISEPMQFTVQKNRLQDSPSFKAAVNRSKVGPSKLSMQVEPESMVQDVLDSPASLVDSPLRRSKRIESAVQSAVKPSPMSTPKMKTLSMELATPSPSMIVAGKRKRDSDVDDRVLELASETEFTKKIKVQDFEDERFQAIEQESFVGDWPIDHETWFIQLTKRLAGSLLPNFLA